MFDHRVVHDVDNNFGYFFHILIRVLGGVVAATSRWREDENGRVAAKHVEEAERAEVDIAFFVDSACKGDGPGDDGALKEGVAFLN